MQCSADEIDGAKHLLQCLSMSPDAGALPHRRRATDRAQLQRSATCSGSSQEMAGMVGAETVPNDVCPHCLREAGPIASERQYRCMKELQEQVEALELEVRILSSEVEDHARQHERDKAVSEELRRDSLSWQQQNAAAVKANSRLEVLQT